MVWHLDFTSGLARSVDQALVLLGLAEAASRRCARANPASRKDTDG